MFTLGITRKFVITLSLKIPLHLVCVATLSCEMSDIAFKPAATPTYCVINVDQAWPVLPKQLLLKSGRLCCLGAFSRWSVNVDNSWQSTSWSRQLSSSETNCHSIWLIAPLVGGVTLNIWCETCKMWQLLWTISTSRLFFVVYFFQCVVTDIVLFLVVAFKTLIFH